MPATMRTPSSGWVCITCHSRGSSGPGLSVARSSSARLRRSSRYNWLISRANTASWRSAASSLVVTLDDRSTSYAPTWRPLGALRGGGREEPGGGIGGLHPERRGRGGGFAPVPPASVGGARNLSPRGTARLLQELRHLGGALPVAPRELGVEHVDHPLDRAAAGRDRLLLPRQRLDHPGQLVDLQVRQAGKGLVGDQT